MTSPTFLLSLAPSDLMLGEMSKKRNQSDFSIVSGSQRPNARGDVECVTSLTFLLSLAPSDLILGEMSRMRNESKKVT